MDTKNFYNLIFAVAAVCSVVLMLRITWTQQVVLENYREMKYDRWYYFDHGFPGQCCRPCIYYVSGDTSFDA